MYKLQLPLVLRISILKTWDPGAWVQMLVLRTWIRTGPRGLLLCHALRTSIFLDPGSWTHGPDDISEDPDQDRPRGPFTLSCFEDLDQDRPRGALYFVMFWGPGSGQAQGPLTLSCFEDLEFKTCDPGSRWSFWGPGLGQAPGALLLRRYLRISIFKTWDPGCPDARWCFWGPGVLPSTDERSELFAAAAMAHWAWSSCSSFSSVYLPVFPRRNDVSSCSLQKFIVSEKKIISFF
jgi:hypothetical protein